MCTSKTKKYSTLLFVKMGVFLPADELEALLKQL